MYKNTKKALLMSSLSLLLCVSMLVGTTFAWFTDSVTTGVNTIQSGKLDVELEYQNKATGATWTAAKDSTEILNKNALWEPGYVEVIKLKVTNKGNLALKYQLGVNISKETLGKNQAGEEFRLSDYIYFGIIEGDKTFNTREDAVNAVKANAKPINAGYMKANSLLADETNYPADIVTMVVYMPTTVGNVANYGEVQPTIELGINLYATQMTAEFDSFNNLYDANAWHDAMTVLDADDLQAALANGGKVMLGADVSFESGLEISKDVALNLNGHTLTVFGEKEALISVAENSDADLTIVNGSLIVESTNGALNGTGVSTGAANAIYFASTGTLTVKDVYIKGSQRGGWRAVEVYNGTGVLTDVEMDCTYGSGVNVGSGASVVLNDCDISVNGMYSAPYNSVCFSVMYGGEMTINSGDYTLTNDATYVTGDTHGGWVGIVMNSGGTLNINGGNFTNVPAAGFVPQYERAIIEAENLDPATATVNILGGTFKPQSQKVVSGYGDVNYPVINAYLIDNGDGTWTAVPEISGVTLTVVANYPHLYTDGTDYYVYTATGLIALNNYFANNQMNNSVWGRNYNIMADIDAAGYTWNNVYMITGTDSAEGINLLGKENGITISNLTIAGGGMLGGTPNCINSTNPAYVKNITFDNVTVTGNAHFAGIVWGGAATCGDVSFENVHVVNSSVTGNCNVGAFMGGTGEQSSTYDLTVTFKDCSVKNTTIVAKGENGADPTGASAYIGRAYANTALVFEGTNVSEDNTITNNGLAGGGVYGYTAWVGSGFAGTGACDSFTNWKGTAALASGQTLSQALSESSNVILPEGNFNVSDASGKAVVLSGTKDTVINVGTAPNLGNADLTFNGVTVKTTNGGFNTGIQHVDTITYNNATIVGSHCLYGNKEVYNNCTFDLTGSSDYLWIYGANDTEFINCTFNTLGKAMLIYNEGDGDCKVVVKGCTFNATQGAKAGDIQNLNCAAIEIYNYSNSGVGQNHTLIAEGNTIDSDFSGEWRIKNFMAGGVVTVNGVEYTKTALDGKLMTVTNKVATFD